MAWNRPNSDSQSTRHKAQGTSHQAPGARHKAHAILAVIVVCLAVGVWLLMRDSGDPIASKNDGARRAKKIAEVKPSIAKKVEAAKEEPKPLPPQRVGEVRDGYRLLSDGTKRRVFGVITNTPPKMSIADKIFTHSADVELGNLLMVEPGDDLLGDTEGMYRGFEKELDEALAEPIRHDKDDTDFQRELKDGVNELREELKRRRAAGEDIEKVMEDTRDQLKELSLYRQELEDQVKQLSTDEMSQQDYEDLVAAANQMLEDRGIKPLELPATLKHTIRLRQIQEEAAKRQAAKEAEAKGNAAEGGATGGSAAEK